MKIKHKICIFPLEYEYTRQKSKDLLLYVHCYILAPSVVGKDTTGSQNLSVE